MGSAGPRYSIASAVTLLAVLFVNVILGVLKQAPCFDRNYELPRAAFRVCQSPLAQALGAPGTPNTDAVTQLTSVSVFTDYFVRAFGSGESFTLAMMLVVGINAVAWIVIGCLLFRVFTERQWLVFVFASPLIALTLGQSFDPVGIALVVVAWFVLTHNMRSGPAVAGVAVAVAMHIQPLAGVVGIAIIVWLMRTGRNNDALTFSGVGIILLGLALMLDASLIGRLQQAFANGLTWGSVGSLVADRADHRVIVAVSLVAWVAATIVGVLMVSKVKQPSLALIASVLMGWALLTLPSSPTSVALWALPFFALTVQNSWAHLSWNLAEVALLIAVNLNIAFQLDKATGLNDAWLAILTIVRLGLVGLMLSLVSDRASSLPVAEVSVAGEERDEKSEVADSAA